MTATTSSTHAPIKYHPADFMGDQAARWRFGFIIIQARLELRDGNSTASAAPMRSSPCARGLTVGAVGVKIFPLVPRFPARHRSGRRRSSANCSRRVAFGWSAAPPATPTITEMQEGMANSQRLRPYISSSTTANTTRSATRSASCSTSRGQRERASSNVVPGRVLMESPDGRRYPFHAYLREAHGLRRGTPRSSFAWATNWPWFDGACRYPQLLQAIVDRADFLITASPQLYLQRDTDQTLAATLDTPGASSARALFLAWNRRNSRRAQTRGTVREGRWRSSATPISTKVADMPRDASRFVGTPLLRPHGHCAAMLTQSSAGGRGRRNDAGGAAASGWIQAVSDADRSRRRWLRVARG